MIPPLILSCERSPRFWTDLVFVTDAETQRDGETFRTPYGCTSESYDIEWSLPGGLKLRLQLGVALDAKGIPSESSSLNPPPNSPSLFVRQRIEECASPADEIRRFRIA